MECDKCKSTNIVVLEEVRGMRYDMFYNDCGHEFYENIE